MIEIMVGKTVEEFVDRVMATASTDTPPNYEDIIAINRGVQDAAFERHLDRTAVPFTIHVNIYTH